MNGNKSFEVIINIQISNIYSFVLISVPDGGGPSCYHPFVAECCDNFPEWLDPENPPQVTQNPDLFYQRLNFDGLNISQIEYYNGCTPGRVKNNYLYDADLYRIEHRTRIND